MTDQHPPAAPTSTETVVAQLSAAVTRLGVRRTRDSWVAGVCDGVALRLGIDPVVVRVAVIVLTLFGGLGLGAYAAGWLLLPAPEGPSVLQRLAARSGSSTAVLALAGVAFGMMVLLGVFFFDGNGWDSGQLVLLLVIGAVAFFVLRRPGAGAAVWPAPDGMPPRATEPHETPAPPHVPVPVSGPASWASDAPGATLEAQTQWAPIQHSPPVAAPPTPRVAPPPRPRRRRLSAWVALMLAGLASAVVAGVSLLATQQGWSGDGVTIGFAAALGAVALILIGAALTGRRGGLSTLLALVLATGTGVAAVASDPHFGGGIGSRSWSVTQPIPADGLRLGIGAANLDLTGPPAAGPGPVRIPVRMGLAELRIFLPSDRTVEVIATMPVGTVWVGDQATTLDHDVRYRRVFGTGTPDITVDVSLRAGDLRIEQG